MDFNQELFVSNYKINNSCVVEQIASNSTQPENNCNLILVHTCAKIFWTEFCY